LQIARIVRASAREGLHVVYVVLSFSRFDEIYSAGGTFSMLNIKKQNNVRRRMGSWGAAFTRLAVAVDCCAGFGVSGPPTPRLIPASLGMGGVPLYHQIAVLLRMLSLPLAGLLDGLSPMLGIPLPHSLTSFFPMLGVVLSISFANLFAACAAVLPIPLTNLLDFLGMVSQPLSLICCMLFAMGKAISSISPALTFLMPVCRAILVCSHSVCPFRSVVRVASMLKHRLGPLLYRTAESPHFSIDHRLNRLWSQA
jgi:hypothetical protein